MEILYVSSVPSPKEFLRIKNQVRPKAELTPYGMNESGYKFHTLIINGLRMHADVHIKALVGRAVNLKTHKGLFWKRRKESISSNLTYNHLAFVNLPIIKHFILGASFFLHTFFWQFKNRKKEKGIILDASYITSNPFIISACKFFHCTTTAIFCDIYEYMANVQNVHKDNNSSFSINFARHIARKTYQNIDTYIFLTQQMNNLINIDHKPYIIMEGLVDIEMMRQNISLEQKLTKQIVMYAGALRKEYGLENLLKGFIAYSNPNAELWIFGDGDYKTKIAHFCNQDSRIYFGGAISLQEIIKKELIVTLLVNPRPSNQEFTQYSFPSKNMEYMVSGTPLLTTCLPGMPKEYYKYVYTIDGSNVQDITRALKDALEKTQIELYEFGQNARSYVLKNKNNKLQAGRILKLLKNEEEFNENTSF